MYIKRKTHIKYTLFLIGAMVLMGCGAHSRDLGVMSQWSNANLIHPDHTGKKWHADLKVSEEDTAALNAQSGLFGFVRILYSDEASERIIYKYSDYLYVQEIRISPEENKLFVRLNGACPGLFGNRECDILKIYDIKNRTLQKTIELDPDDDPINEVNVNE